MNDQITIPVCDKNMTAELNTELSMPDYQPEVRRLLRVCISLTPPEPYFDGSRVGMSGEAIYNILYAAEDGGLYSLEARENYELNEALRGYDSTQGLNLVGDVIPESIVSRVTAPRKLSIRCRLRGRIRGFSGRELSESVTYIDDPSSIRRLEGSAEYAQILPTVLLRTELTDNISLSGQSEDARIVWHNAAVEVEDVESRDGEALVKGAVRLTLLSALEDSDGAPVRSEHRLPFAEIVEVEGLTSDGKCTAWGCCSSALLEVEGDSIGCTLALCLRVDPWQTVNAVYTEDMYSTEVESETVMRWVEFPAMAKSFSGNLSVSAREALEELGIDGGAEIIDAVADASVKNIEYDRRKWATAGEVSLNLLCRQDGEYFTKDMKIPFRYEVEGDEGDTALAFATATPLSVRVRGDGSRVIADCELKVAGNVCLKGSAQMVEQCIFGDPVEKDDAITVCFTSPDDDLWQVSKRYHASADGVLAKNPANAISVSGFVII